MFAVISGDNVVKVFDDNDNEITNLTKEFNDSISAYDYALTVAPEVGFDFKLKCK